MATIQNRLNFRCNCGRLRTPRFIDSITTAITGVPVWRCPACDEEYHTGAVYSDASKYTYSLMSRLLVQAGFTSYDSVLPKILKETGADVYKYESEFPTITGRMLGNIPDIQSIPRNTEARRLDTMVMYASVMPILDNSLEGLRRSIARDIFNASRYIMPSTGWYSNSL